MRSIGILRYSPKLLGERTSEKWWLVLDCNESIGIYLRHLYWLSKFRTQILQRPAWREHVTVIRNEEPQNQKTVAIECALRYNRGVLFPRSSLEKAMKKAEEKSKPRMGKPVKLRVVSNDSPKEAPPTEADRAYYRDLHKVIDQVFQEAANAYDWTWSRLAVQAGLGYMTVANLGDRKTRWPRFSTIWRLCKAVGWDLKIATKPKSQRKIIKLAKTA